MLLGLAAYSTTLTRAWSNDPETTLIGLDDRLTDSIAEHPHQLALVSRSR
jgi:hypothetical protein